MSFIADVNGKMLNSSSIAKHVLQLANDSMNLSLKRGCTS